MCVCVCPLVDVRGNSKYVCKGVHPHAYPSVSALGQPYLGGQGGGEVTILVFYRACVALTAFLSLIQYRILASEEAVIRFL